MKLISLLSGGIDSPVATYLMLKRDIEVVALHFWGEPYTDKNALERVRSVVKQLQTATGRDIKTAFIPIGEKRFSIARECNRRLQCVLCKRLMYKIAERLAEKEKANALLTGESIAQVASQTLYNLEIIDQAVGIPVLRPLIGFDKEEIIKIARDIGTYEISTQKGICCGLVPRKPTTQARLDEIIECEDKIDFDKIINEATQELEWLT